MTIARIDQLELLRLARASIASALMHGRLAPFTESVPAALNEPRASFVTLRAGPQLRGCCGSIEPRYALAEDVWRNAWASAFSDPRFPSLEREEFDDLHVHISVLTPLERLQVTSEDELLASLRPGRDGLLLEAGAASATFLPSVWDTFAEPHDFVRHLKMKAGWSATAWPAQIQVWRYETESFEEEAN